MMPRDDAPKQLAAARNVVGDAVGEFVVESVETVDNNRKGSGPRRRSRGPNRARGSGSRRHGGG